ncbi:TlpA disulfide reductase family protein [Nubsella zeaxanthinifaciens]|jgi:thiol-disulfide isomerase/thioredoxin|uniref:TlpA disulfide reductase family protein n=1 Tax=Nubsella zeaxanthinifaciens TaxID=392412 RepID=UPI000DE24907|nr:TlpA disulfide reductase family protein [Nubsella zeaxanthinifaciens]
MLAKLTVTIVLILTGLVANAQVKLLTLNELDARVAKGNDTTYVINFWATWCVPCVEELPYFEKLNAAKFEKPVKVILMSLDFKSKLTQDVIPFVTQHQIKSEVFVVDEPDQQKLIDRVDKKWSGALPATLIINTAQSRRSFYERTFNYEELKAVLNHR